MLEESVITFSWTRNMAIFWGDWYLKKKKIFSLEFLKPEVTSSTACPGFVYFVNVSANPLETLSMLQQVMITKVFLCALT